MLKSYDSEGRSWFFLYRCICFKLQVCDGFKWNTAVSKQLDVCLSFETIPKYLSSLDFSPKWLGGTDAILSTLTTILESIILQFIVCSYHVMYTFQSKSTLYSCLNVKELLAQSRCASLSDCNWTGTQHSTI